MHCLRYYCNCGLIRRNLRALRAFFARVCSYSLVYSSLADPTHRYRTVHVQRSRPSLKRNVSLT
ncbi:Protein of unknown function [Pyronema omphalodes CBS 100304]|uniref:Uncharacterized protein n=1 Tax=Pyronema omphalodes (strain CBS 100304) TaxID=1076935 RepID=U4LNV7_PYROM|nr:Protein of unknown function [Pyronema omphalodes CBS 100304]